MSVLRPARNRPCGVARARSDTLLANILPQRIAERLKAGSGTIAERFEEATVLFADIARFTSLAETITPHELVSLLDRIFTRFDELADVHGLEKIKTVGDAYMLAGGVPEARGDHVEAVADAALAMHRALDELGDARVGSMAMRIGIHTGRSSRASSANESSSTTSGAIR